MSYIPRSNRGIIHIQTDHKFTLIVVVKGHNLPVVETNGCLIDIGIVNAAGELDRLFSSFFSGLRNSGNNHNKLEFNESFVFVVNGPNRPKMGGNLHFWLDSTIFVAEMVVDAKEGIINTLFAKVSSKPGRKARMVSVLIHPSIRQRLRKGSGVGVHQKANKLALPGAVMGCYTNLGDL